jgi:hypothetical protein
MTVKELAEKVAETENKLDQILAKLGVEESAPVTPEPTPNGNGQKPEPTPEPEPAKVTTPRELVVTHNQGDDAATYGVASLTKWGERKGERVRIKGLNIRKEDLAYVIESLIDIFRAEGLEELDEAA